jgi:ubiquinol-cytochrome c reductase cytochrome b subunit
MGLLRRIWAWVDDRAGLGRIWDVLAKHRVPPGTGWMYVFGAATLTAFIVQVITGIALATVYVPAADSAYQSLEFITNRSTLGNLVRGLHYFGASAMIFFVGVHMVRVFLSASYKYPRELNWITGVALLGLTVTMGFTGQLLRWDQNAVWSAVVAAEQAGRTPWVGKALAHFILGGRNIGGATLSRFFAAHVFLLPGLIMAIIGAHLYLVIRNGISEPPRAGQPVDPATYRDRYNKLLQERGLPFWPYAAWRDIAFAALVVLGIVLLAALIGPPVLGKPPDPTIVQAQPRPDWYMLWYFALLALLPHGSERYLILLIPLGIGLALIVLPLLANRGERSPSRRPWSIALVMSVAVVVGVLWHEGARAPWSPDFSAKPLSADVVNDTTDLVIQGARLFHAKGCQFCHRIAGHGGQRGPDLSTVGDELTSEQLTVQIMDGGYNMPAYGGNLRPDELEALVAFLQSRTSESRAVPTPLDAGGGRADSGR